MYDLAGRVVRTLANGVLPAGYHQRVWDGRTQRGVMAASGVYFYRLEVGGAVQQRKMLILK